MRIGRIGDDEGRKVVWRSDHEWIQDGWMEILNEWMMYGWKKDDIQMEEG